VPYQARLSVNLNKVALLRNSRHTGVPDVLTFARLAYEAGADGITVHPRPDERHIRRDDVLALAELMRPWRPRFELNVEGYPDERLLDIVQIVKPEQCTLVPDAPTAFTSEEGWKLNNEDTPLVSSAASTLKACGCRVILFVDPNPGVVSRIPGTGGTRSHPPASGHLTGWVDLAEAANGGTCVTERTGFYAPYGAPEHPGTEPVRTSRPLGFAAGRA